MKLQEMMTAASGMSVSDRAALTNYLLDSFEDDDSTDKDWLAIAEERMAEVKAGKAVGIPAEEVLRTLLDPES
jgi:hypothetical protein